MIQYQSMVRAFIDESGNLGRGGKYFVLAAAVFDTGQGAKRASRLIRKEQLYFAKSKPTPTIEEIKSCHLSVPQRQHILTKLISKADIDVFYLVVDKQKVDLLRQNKPKNLVYNYFAKLLTDQIFSRYNDDFVVIFDQRSTAVKSMNSLVDYITINAYTQHQHVNHEIQVEQRDSKTQNNLQTADILAGTIAQAYSYQNCHFLNMLQERIVKADEFPRSTFEGGLLSPKKLDI